MSPDRAASLRRSATSRLTLHPTDPRSFHSLPLSCRRGSTGAGSFTHLFALGFRHSVHTGLRAASPGTDPERRRSFTRVAHSLTSPLVTIYYLFLYYYKTYANK